MNVLLIGSGGREHALAWKIAQSPLLTTLYAAPGNPGMTRCVTLVGLDVKNHGQIVEFCRENGVDLVVIGPEAPLVAGLADDLRAEAIACFGASKAAAQLEGSKQFTKELCDRMSIPTAGWASFTDAAIAKDHLSRHGAPIVVKADGLAAGKGVTVAMSEDEAAAAIDDCFDGAFGEAGASVVLEEFLDGEEASFFCLCDGETALPIGTAQDHKRAFDGDRGPNTGGMGAYSPAPILTAERIEEVMDRIVRPTMKGMAESGTPFVGVLYAGLMMTAEGPKLIEYNVRFGDPECQVLMTRLQSDLLPLLTNAAHGRLSADEPAWSDDAALTVVVASEGYPASPQTGWAIEGIDEAEEIDGCQVFHAGTKHEGDRLVAAGGRVLNVTAIAASVTEAAAKAYDAISRLRIEGGFYRRDIGWRAMKRERG